jgi:hypothetical protein
MMNSVDQKCVRCGRDTGRRLRMCKACASHDVSIASEIKRQVKQELARNPSYVIDTRQRGWTEPRFPMNERRP